MSGPLSIFDRPNSYIGRSVPRPNTRRLVEGRGHFVDDLSLPRMVHAAFLRSPYAHARIARIDTAAAKAAADVVAVYTGADLVAHIEPWVGVLSHLKGLRSAPQPAVAVDVARWQGEPVAMVVAASRAAAEDAAALIEVDYQPLPAAVDAERALDPGEPVIHGEFDSNLAWERLVDEGDVEAALADPDATVVERTFVFGRHTGVTLEPRCALAAYDPAEGRLTVHYSGQSPHMMQFIYAKHLGLPEDHVRIIAHDVGGSFGIKIHTYGDEIATAAAAMLIKRPVKYVADRFESFQSDIHARGHRVTARVAVAKDGKITGFDMDDLTGIGPYSVYPRTSAIEANQVLNLTGAPYVLPAYRARGRVVFQNKTVMCQYRAVGHPIATAVTEGMLDAAAAATGRDPAELRRLNLIPDDCHPCTSATGLHFNELSHHACLDKLLAMMDYDGLRAEQTRLREQGVYRGIGLSSFVEVTNPSPMFYGVGGAPIASQDGATVRLDASGAVHISSSVTEQGQGTEAVLAQVVATAVGVPLESVRVTTGDTETTPYGGGTWASRGAGIGGEAALLAGRALRDQVLEAAAVILQANAAELDIADGKIVDADSGRMRVTLADLARQIYYRGNELPRDLMPELIATRHFRVTDYAFVFTGWRSTSRPAR